MYLIRVQAPVTHQFAAEQQHRYLMAIAHFRGVLGIDVDHVDGKRLSFRQCGELAQHLFAQAAARARVHQETQQFRAHRRQWRGISALPPDDLTEWAMNSTVWAGTSPTAVTWWP